MGLFSFIKSLGSKSIEPKDDRADAELAASINKQKVQVLLMID